MIAVIGMAGRFPGAADLTEFWQALADGRELLTTVDGATHGLVRDADLFDPAFFDYAPSEALLIDPQQRVFLECAWEALEHAGQVPGDTVVGVYAGSGDTDHLPLLRANRHRFPEASELQLRLASGADFLTSRVAYKLGLTGPAVTVQAACATSLVAVHTASQALLAGECDIALAGGVTVHVPFPADDPGEDGIVAADGHCRPFDAAASGTIASDGAGVVVLKRLDDAIADGDPIHAVLLGSAVTNDGMAKVGFAAPSVAGQVAAIRAAHEVADVDPATVSYVEAHGTGTPVGDPIEVRALNRAFGADGHCLLGSVKANIGHTDAAAGVLGLIKVVLALRAGVVPPNPHFRTPNPELDLASGPFEVNAEPAPWPRDDQPRRAGVNSLGLGGVNAHAVLEEPPVRESGPGREYQLFPLSARTPKAVTDAAGRLATYLGVAPLPDIAWTLQTGRKAFEHRTFVVGASPEDIVVALERPEVTKAGERGVVFLFPGQGGQHVGMGADLYRTEPVFARVIDECAELAAPELGLDLRDVLLGRHTDAATALSTMEIGQPAVFAVELALARLWQSWGVEPVAVLGHSLGAYAAATVAGVLNTADALTLVLERGRILGGLPAGAMLALPLSPSDLQLGDDLSLAAVNGPEQCVVAGPVEAVTRLRDRLAADGINGSLLHISTAAHSHLVEPELPRFEKVVTGVMLTPPAIPWISDRTGQAVAPEEAVDPAYWGAHLRHTVNFSDALAALLADGDHAVVEVGPGRTLAGLTRRHPAGASRVVTASLPHAADEAREQPTLLTAAGRLWQSGVPLDWAALHRDERRLRVPLPTYPFQRTRLRVDLEDTGETVATEVVVADDATATERAVAAAFGAVLGLPEIDRGANFFELGGDSMLAVRVLTALRGEGFELSARAIFRAQTVSALAALIEENS